MADEKTSDMRLLAERMDRNHAEDRADIARLEAQVAAIPAAMDRYVLQRVYEADEKRRLAEREEDHRRIGHLENNETTKVAGSRAWLVGISLAAIGGVFGYIAQILSAKGGH